ncbi:hypothetical protein C8F01DRAFT_1376840 [Mycena amicta]|nr:hypothetical protein C8F01DRAFT_1376840 [Mycena amicta]
MCIASPDIKWRLSICTINGATAPGLHSLALMLLLQPPRSFSRHILLLLLHPLLAAAQTTIFDDADSSFSWYGEWTAVSGNCDSCSTKLDPTQTRDGTWHDGDRAMTSSEQTGGSFSFTGTAVQIYGIDQPDYGPDIVFTLEGFTSTHHYTGNAKVYHSLFFSRSGLTNGAHTVNWVLQVDPSTDPGLFGVVALFDYAVVTSTEDNRANPHGTTTTTGTTLTSSSTSSASHSLAKSSSIRTSPSFTSSGTSRASTVAALQTSSSTSSSVPTNSNSSSTGIGTQHRSSSVDIIVGTVIGIIALLAFLGAAVCLWRRRTRSNHARIAAFLAPNPPGNGTTAGSAVAAPPAVVLLSEKDALKSRDPFWPESISVQVHPPTMDSQIPTPSSDPQSTSASALSPLRFHSTNTATGASPQSSPISPSRAASLATSSHSRGGRRTHERERLLEARVAELEATVIRALAVGLSGQLDAYADEGEGEDSQPPPYVRGSTASQPGVTGSTIPTP